MLELEDVEAGYGQFRAIFGVSFSVPPRSAVALLGANGAGKSTVARVATGLVPATSGTVRFSGADVTRLRPYRRARMGMTHVPEGRSVLGTLTVEENLMLHARGRRRRAAAGHRVDEALDAFPRLAERRHQRAGTLSGGEQRMLSLAWALTNPPELLVVDELSLGLAPLVVDELYRVLKAIRDSGASLLIVEQHVDRALSLADQVVLLKKGEVARAGPASELKEVAASLLGM